MDFLGEGVVTVHSEHGSTAYGVTVLRNGLSAQQVLLKQADGKAWKVSGVGPVEPWARRILSFLQTAHDRGLVPLLESGKRNATVLDGGGKDGARALVLREAGGVTRYLVDSVTSRVTRMEFQRGRSPDLSGRLLPNLESYVFSDFRMINGLATAFKVEHFVNGAKREELQFASVRYVAAKRDAAPGPIRAVPDGGR